MSQKKKKRFFPRMQAPVRIYSIKEEEAEYGAGTDKQFEKELGNKSPGTELEDLSDSKNGSQTSADLGLSQIVIFLLKGVIYQENEQRLWTALLKFQARVREYISVLGLELILDEAEGYAYLRSVSDEDEKESESSNVFPRLVARRALSFPVSLLLALLRKKLAEFDATGGDTRLILSREEILELVRVFLPDNTNETKLYSQLDANINKVVDLGFLRRLQASTGKNDNFEVRRILKAFVDAQWLSEFDRKLEEYKNKMAEA